MNAEGLGFLGEVDGIHRAPGFALTAEKARFCIQYSCLRYRGGEGNANSPIGTQVLVECIRHCDRTGIFAQPATSALGAIHKARLLQHGGYRTSALLADGLHLGISKHAYIGMVCGCSHLWGGDAAGAIQGGEHLAERDHLAAHAGFALHQRYLETLVGQVNRGLQTGDTAPNPQRVKVESAHTATMVAAFCISSPARPISVSNVFIWLTSLRNGLTHTVHMAVSRRRRISRPRC